MGRREKTERWDNCFFFIRSSIELIHNGYIEATQGIGNKIKKTEGVIHSLSKKRYISYRYYVSSG